MNVNKIKNLPKTLIYSPSTDVYRMFSTKTSKQIGEMKVNNFHYKDIPCLEIVSLLINQKREGFGRQFINFARKESYARNLNGNLYVIAGGLNDENGNAPHQFYRKLGFKSDNKKLLRRVDWSLFTRSQIKNFDIYDLEFYSFPEENQSLPKWMIKLRKLIFNR